MSKTKPKQTPNSVNESAGEESRYHHGDLRSALLERAAEVIDEFGIEAVTLRGLARDLGVSHGAPNRHFRNKAELLAGLASYGYSQLKAATLDAAEAAADDPWIQLNAMGRGYLKWAVNHRALFHAMNHPDVGRNADASLIDKMDAFRSTVFDATLATQKTGRHPEVDPKLLSLYTNAVPFGVAAFINGPMFVEDVSEYDLDELIAEVIELVVPIKDRMG